MRLYADLNFYQNTYKGFVVPAEKVNFYVNKASRYIDNNITKPISFSTEDVLKAGMAACELADVMYGSDNSEVSSEKVGSYSVSYAQKHTPETLKSTLWAVHMSHLSEFVQVGLS